ncbi:MAG: radical SAM protein [Acidobacteria bacterium]|nr:MAG: radical SAM protein [Acidobacteriota bacterium]
MSERVEAVIPNSALEDEVRDHRIHELPILVLFPHNRCNCRCLMCDIWKIRQAREITAEDLRPHLESLRELRVRWIVFSGGEPLMHSDLESLVQLCRDEGIRMTLLTAGLLLKRQAGNVTRWMDDVIISIDGPPGVHDAIRSVPGAFTRLSAGIREVRRLSPQMPVHGRCTVQKRNFRHLRDTVRTAHALGLNSISFLAADTTSEAFNRPLGWPSARQESIALDATEVGGLDVEINALIRECQREIESGFISENPDKLRRIVLHYRASLGQTQNVSPRCNAPWVSAVVEADGTVRPCFFHRAIGNIREASLRDVLNGEQALRFRRELDVARDPVCQKCVCSLYLAEEAPVP